MKTIKDRGQLGTSRLTQVIIALAIAGVIFSFLIPVAINSMEGDITSTLTQDTTVEYEVNAALNSTVTATDTTADTATIELTADGGATTSKTVDLNTDVTYSFERGDVVVNATEITSTNATVEYDYPRDFAYSDGARNLWSLISLAIILGGLLLFLGIGMSVKS